MANIAWNFRNYHKLPFGNSDNAVSQTKSSKTYSDLSLSDHLEINPNILLRPFISQKWCFYASKPWFKL